MQIELVRIGNSRGVRIPKFVIDQCGFGPGVDLQVEDGRVVLARQRKPREGWKEALEASRHRIAHDELLLQGIPEHELNGDEWNW